jgi:hypothetical protein
MCCATDMLLVWHGEILYCSFYWHNRLQNYMFYIQFMYRGDSKRVLVMVLNWASCEGGIRVTASIHHQKRFMHAKLVMAWLHIFVCDNFKCIIPCQLHSSYLLPTSSHRIVSVTGAANIDVQQHKLSMRYSPWFTVHKSH